MQGIGGAGFLYEIVGSIHHVMPGAAVPVVRSDEIQYARALDIQADVEIIRRLVQKVAGVRALVAARAVIRAAHIRPRPDTLVRPPLPLPVRIQSNRNNRRFLRYANRDNPQ